MGRHDELAGIDVLVAALTSGTGGVLVLRGEAGIGKSHLAGIAVSRATDAAVEVVVAEADELERDRPAHVLAQVIGGLDEGQDRKAVTPDVTASDRPGDGDPAHRITDRFVAAVEAAATRRPVLVVVEDLHWADELSLRGLAALVRRVDQAAYGVVVTTRPHPRPARLGTFEAQARAAGGQVIELGGLEPEAVAELAVSLIGGRPGEHLRARLAGAAGNPFMIEELARAGTRQRLIEVHDGVADLAAGELPSSLRDVLLDSIHTLPPQTIEMLRVASLLGTRFTATEVATLTDRSVIEVVDHLRPAVDAGAVEGDDDDHHRFRHDLVREATYASIPAAARWDLHRAAGAALAGAGAPALRVAQQFSAGARPGDVEAVEWLQRAADEALALDTGAAADLLRRALSLAPHDAPDRFEREADLVELLAWSGRIDEATTRGQSLVDRALDAHQRFRAHRALGAVRSSIGDLGSAADELRAAANEDGVDPTDAAQLTSAAAGMAVIAGTRSADAAEVEVRPFLDGGDAAVLCVARNTLAVTAFASGAYDQALDHARVASAILDDRYVRPLGFLIPHSWSVAAHMYLDRVDDARVAARRARERAEARGDAGLLLQIMAATCGLTWAECAWDETEAEIDAATVLADETGVVAQTILLRSLASHIARERGQVEDADAHLAAAEAFAASGTMHLFGLDLLAFEQARVRCDRGDVDGACDVLAGVWDAVAGIRGLIQWRLVGPEAVALCVRAGRRDHAASIAADVRDLARRSSAPSAAATARRATGLVDRDADALVGAADAMLATPRRAEAAAACEDAARLLIETGCDGQDDVARLLDAAAQIHTQAAATAGLDRVRDLRRRAGLETSEAAPRPTFGWGSLTPKEREVVALVSRGMSNPEIADELFISRRTVEAHLSHVFRKVEVANRTQLAREAIEQERRGQAT